MILCKKCNLIKEDTFFSPSELKRISPRYNLKTWNDNDPYTWTWQLDRIIPQCDLLYDSAEHPNFSKCWSLNNLRPLSSKKNYFDGIAILKMRTK